MPAKMARSAPQPPFGLPEVTVAIRTSLLSCGKAEKPRISMQVRESSGESRIELVADVITIADRCKLGPIERPLLKIMRNR